MTRGLDGGPHEGACDAGRAEGLGGGGIVEAAPPWYGQTPAMTAGGPRGRLGGGVGFGYAAPPITLFNRVIGLGVLAPATSDALDEAIGAWAGTGRTFVVHASHDNASAELALLLEARGIQRSRSWAK